MTDNGVTQMQMLLFLTPKQFTLCFDAILFIRYSANSACTQGYPWPAYNPKIRSKRHIRMCRLKMQIQESSSKKERKCIYLFYKYLLNICSEPHTLPGDGNTAVKRNRNAFSCEFYIQTESQTTKNMH